jgi:hypothetical protein
MAEGAMMMIHRASTVSMGDAEDLRKDADLLEKFEKGLISVYSKKTGMDDEQISEMLKEETWMDSLEAVALGFADGITDNTPAMAKVTPAELKARFDKFASRMATPTNTDPEPVAPVVEPVVEPVAPVANEPAPVVEVVPPVESVDEPKTDEEKPDTVEPTVPVEEPAKVENPVVYAKATEITAKFAELTAKLTEANAKLAAFEDRALTAEASKKATEDALDKLERSLGIASAKVEPVTVSPVAATPSDVMTWEEFSKLSATEKPAFIRRGGRIEG